MYPRDHATRQEAFRRPEGGFVPPAGPVGGCSRAGRRLPPDPGDILAPGRGFRRAKIFSPAISVFTEIKETRPLDPTYRTLLGEAAWHRLSRAIRRRFGHKPATGETIRYPGVMEEVRATKAGWLLAQALRLAGTPIAPYAGRGVPIEVEVFAEPRGGLVWRRTYRFPGRRPVTVASVKRPDRRAGLIEVVGGGFGMTLKVSERAGELRFLSRRYFWQVGPVRVPLPDLLSPGRLEVVHADEPDGRFRFTMTVRHPLLGETFFQDGVFREVGRA